MFDDLRLSLTLAVGTALIFVAVIVGTAGGAPNREPGEAFAGGSVQISGGWAAATIGQGTTSAAYLVIENTGARDDRLVSARIDGVPVTEIHMNVQENGVMGMRPVDGIPLPAGEAVTLEPGGFHLMLMQLGGPLADGDALDLTLSFENAPEQQVTLPVRKRDAGRPGHGDHDSHGDGSHE